MEKYINAIRFLGVDAINQANSGHPGIVLGAAPMAYALFTKQINVNPKKSDWANRDRFILSAGHGSALLYAINHLSGYKVTIEDIKRFRQLGNTPGHPEYGHTDGVETTSGPLGQGISNAVGIALAETHLAAKFNKPGFDIVDHYTYVICGDGDLQEGVALEAMSLAGHLELGKLVVLFDSNDIQLDGTVDLAYSEIHKKKFEAMGWHYQLVLDGNNVEAINQAIKKAKKHHKPSIIEIKTEIGFGTKNAGTSKVHGAPIGIEEASHLRKVLNWTEEPFVISSDVYDHYKKNVLSRGRRQYNKWEKTLKDYQVAHKALYDEYLTYHSDIKPVDLELFKDLLNKDDATRNVSGKAIEILSHVYPNLIGGSADLTSSTKAKGADGHYSKENRLGRNINYGVREHAMGAVSNGIVLHGGLKSFTGAFFVFSDYMKPALRLSAIMNIPAIYVFSHDTIAVGEDGPTHQPVEQLVGLRSIPNFNVIRPADAKETVAAWKIALESKGTPTAIILTRQTVKNYEKTNYEGVLKGGYIVSSEQNKLDGIILTCGSELELAMEAQTILREKGIDIRVVSMPSAFNFDKQSSAYQNEILPKGIKILAVEMASPYSWYKYTKNVFGLETFGVSAPASVALKHFNFTKEKVAEAFLKI